MKTALYTASLLLLAACSDSTQIQREYDDVRDECRGAAEGTIGNYIPTEAQTDQRDFNAQLTALFSDCMFEKGWTVATPPREGGEVAENSGWGTSPQHPEILTRSSAAQQQKQPPQPPQPPQQPQPQQQPPQQAVQPQTQTQPPQQKQQTGTYQPVPAAPPPQQGAQTPPPQQPPPPTMNRQNFK